MKMSGSSLELARMSGRSDTLNTWIDVFEEDLINELLLDTLELDRFKQGRGTALCSFLDCGNLDESLQFLRFSKDYSGRPLGKVIKYRCQVANASESFYRCISAQNEFLRTVIQPRLTQKSDAIEIHSNVVPRMAYLTRLVGVEPTCPGRELCTRGFFPTSVLYEGEPPRQCCKNCSLVKQLRRREAHTSAAVVRFWEFKKQNMIKLVNDHARLGEGSSQGEIEKVLWRKGIFVRKRFYCPVLRQSCFFRREILVAMDVSHPNIVHYFGFSLWPDNGGYCDLFMELLDGDLEKLLVELSRTGDRLSIRDVLEVLLQIAEAMRHLHEKHFVHGDLKLGNILVSKLDMAHSDAQFYLVKVADFGCAQPIDPISGATVEDFDFKIGTLAYTAPEVLSGRNHGRASLQHPQKIDVFSFGVIAYQVITGATKVYPKGFPHIRERVIEGSLRPDYNGQLSTLVGKRFPSLHSLPVSCWAANPNERPTFARICASLRGFVEYYNN